VIKEFAVAKRVWLLIELDGSKADPEFPDQLSNEEYEGLVRAVESIGGRLLSGAIDDNQGK
jgi:hypothetical protein